jgi:hypothetical protein
MQVIRLEFEEILPNHPATGALFTWKTVADYGAVRIGEKEFWLLTKMVKSGTGGEWIADYSNCRKFEVTTTIRPAD